MYKNYKLKACLKRYVLRWHLKLQRESRLDILQGRLFQSVESILPLGVSSIILSLDLSKYLVDDFRLINLQI